MGQWASIATGGRGGLRGSVAATLVLLGWSMPLDAHAGTFEITWGQAPFTWTQGDTGPTTFTMTDARGFALDVTFTFTETPGGGAYFAGFPQVFNGFGTAPTIGVAYQPTQGTSNIGGSTVQMEMALSSGGVAFPTDGMDFVVSDIDAVDNNTFQDRCDFVTLTGDNGNPLLSYVSTVAADRTVIIGGAGVNGSGVTGPLAANQAQCVYVRGGATNVPGSDGDDNGSILATYPGGTSVATIAYDESIENVWGFGGFTAAARGIGAFATIAVTVDDANAIDLVKTADRPAYDAVGQTITYTYTVTNNGRLPINAGQDIVVEDSRIGTIPCTSGTAVPVGGSTTCTATYQVTATDLGASTIDNTAVAGIGLPGQAFAERLQSNTATESVGRASARLTKTQTSGPNTASAAGQVLGYVIEVENIGAVDLTGPTLADLLPGGVAGTASLTGGDGDSDGAIDIGETWSFAISYTVTQGDIDAGGALVNVASLDANELSTTLSDQVSTPVATTPAVAISKTVDDPLGVTVGQVLTYTYDVTNTGNQTLTTVSVADAHNAFGPPPTPAGETLLFDSNPAGDSNDTIADGAWDSLAPGDTIRFTGTYTVRQEDVDRLQ